MRELFLVVVLLSVLAPAALALSAGTPILGPQSNFAGAKIIQVHGPAVDVDVDCTRDCAAELPPPRTELLPGYRAPPELVTWKPFTYSPPAHRREAVRDYVRKLSSLPQLPPLHIVLIGGVAAGKGTIAPMVSQAFRTRVVGIGALLRGEARAARTRGREAAQAMQRGELLPDSLVLQLLEDRLASDTDIAKNGWLLDGFPRSRPQAEAILADNYTTLRPDAVVLIERPDELVKEFALGRCCDSTTGQTYHPIYAPPPEELYDKLVWRVDDTYVAMERRIAEHKQSIDGIVEAFELSGVPVQRFDNARSELETFADVATYLEGIAMQKLSRARDALLAERRQLDAASGMSSAPNPFVALSAYGGPAFQSGDFPSAASVLSEAVEALQPAPSIADAEDVEMYCDVNEDEESCVARFQAETVVDPLDVAAFCDLNEPEGACLLRYQEEVKVGALLAAVRRCNTYNPSDFVPVLVGEQQIGWLNERALDALAPQLAIGIACELVDLNGRALSQRIPTAPEATSAVRIAPQASSALVATEYAAAMVEELVADGLIPSRKLRHELQDVHPLSLGFVAAGEATPALQLERAAMIYFGVPSHGVHVNGWVRDPKEPANPRPWGMWVAKRSLSKATCAPCARA